MHYAKVALFIWWYLVSYEPSGLDFQAMIRDSSRPGSVLGEYSTLSRCDDQLSIYYARNPYSFARCEGSKIRQNYSNKRSLEMQKLELEIRMLRQGTVPKKSP